MDSKPVWDVPLLCGQGANDIAEGGQGLVDGLCLLQLLSSGPALLHPV